MTSAMPPDVCKIIKSWTEIMIDVSIVKICRFKKKMHNMTKEFFANSLIAPLVFLIILRSIVDVFELGEPIVITYGTLLWLTIYFLYVKRSTEEQIIRFEPYIYVGSFVMIGMAIYVQAFHLFFPLACGCQH